MTGSAGPPGPNSAGIVQKPSSVTQPTTAVQQPQAASQWAAPMGQSLSGTNYTLTTTGNTQEWAWSKEHEVSKIVKRAKNGYFFVISVDAQDSVFYRVWRGGWFPYMVAKVFKRFGADIEGSMGSWNSVTKRSHLPATIGSAYEMIDVAVAEDIEFEEHEEYVKDLLTTKPENLKMIGGLEKLAEGDADDTRHEPPQMPPISPAGSSNATSPWVSHVSSSTVSFQNATDLSSAITGVSTLEAKKIVLNGTDLAQVVSDSVKKATDEMVLKLIEKEEDVKELSAP